MTSMQKDLLGKIDLLIEMSKSPSNIDTLKAELADINEEIENKKHELEELSHSMKDEKYMKASDRIIDENIKVSLELKLQKMAALIKEEEKKAKELVSEEERAHKEQETLKNRISQLENLLKALEEKLTSSNTDASYYQTLSKETEKKKQTAEVELAKKEEEYQKISLELTDTTSRLETLKRRELKESEKLKDTEESLESNEAYIDNKLKEEDLKRIENLEEKMEELETRKEEIETDPVMIGNEAKELYIEDDRTGSFAKVKELVNLIKKQPYMEIASKSERDTILKEKEEEAILKRDEFASMIENKKYDGNDTEIITEREKHLENRKKELENEYNQTKEKIKEIDTIKVKEISSLLSAATIVSENLKKSLEEYKKVVEDDKENLTPKKKAVLMAAYNKKEEELASVETITKSYENDLEELMKESTSLNDKTLVEIEKKIEHIEQDLKDLRKRSMISSKTKDVLAVENDKAKLKELTDQVKEIAECQKYAQTPSEIYDEIEMNIGSFEEREIESAKETEEKTASLEETSEEMEPVETPVVQESESMDPKEEIPEIFDSLRSEKNKDILKEETIDIPWEKNPFEELEPEITEPPKEETTIAKEEPSPSMSPFEINESILSPTKEKALEKVDTQEPKEEPVTNRLRVIQIEPIEEKEPKLEEVPKEEDVVLSDLKDDDYIDFDSLIAGGNV